VMRAHLPAVDHGGKLESGTTRKRIIFTLE
jgi:hypothetical protein